MRYELVDAAERTDTAVRIRTAAIFLFATQGYAATGVREIARQVGLSNAGVYHFVGSKESLLFEIMRDVQRRLDEALEGPLARATTPEDRLAVLISGLVGAHLVNKMSSRVTDGEIRALVPGSPAHQEIVAMRDRHEVWWRDALSDGVAEGVFQIANQHLTRLALLAMCTGVSEWYDPAGPTDPGAICREFVGIGLAAVQARRNGVAIRPDDVAIIEPSGFPRMEWEPQIRPLSPEHA